MLQEAQPEAAEGPGPQPPSRRGYVLHPWGSLGVAPGEDVGGERQGGGAITAVVGLPVPCG